ncbi:4 TM domain-containing transmembrane protein [Acrasis kona]|uniref:4 TM domain-containing transmembrane protein n=1 Tax=Acrasis kona TaxID=1008807 RepID=A0AAW2ZFX2_9EUKA
MHKAHENVSLMNDYETRNYESDDERSDNDAPQPSQDVQVMQGSSIVVGGGGFKIKRGNQSSSENDIVASTKMEEARDVLSRIVYSKYYFVFYVIMILMSTVLLVWNIYTRGHPRHVGFTLLEGAITTMLVVELSFRIIIQRSAFFSSVMNWVDLIIITMCTISFLLYLRSVRNSTQEEVGELIDALLIALRYSTQMLQIVLFIKNQKMRSDEVKEHYIDLTEEKFDLETPVVSTPMVEMELNSESDSDSDKNEV